MRPQRFSSWQRLVRAGLTCALGAALIGCQPAPTPPAVDPSPGEDLPVLWEKSGTYSRLAKPVRLVVRNRATLARVPITDVPIDFDSQMALVAGLGPTPSGEFGIRITRVWREGSQLRVQERRILPGPEGAVGLSPASPWTIVIVPRSDLNVEGYSAQVPDGLLHDLPGGW